MNIERFVHLYNSSLAKHNNNAPVNYPTRSIVEEFTRSRYSCWLKWTAATSFGQKVTSTHTKIPRKCFRCKKKTRRNTKQGLQTKVTDLLRSKSCAHLQHPSGMLSVRRTHACCSYCCCRCRVACTIHIYLYMYGYITLQINTEALRRTLQTIQLSRLTYCHGKSWQPPRTRKRRRIRLLCCMWKH